MAFARAFWPSTPAGVYGILHKNKWKRKTSISHEHSHWCTYMSPIQTGGGRNIIIVFECAMLNWRMIAENTIPAYIYIENEIFINLYKLGWCRGRCWSHMGFACVCFMWYNPNDYRTWCDSHIYIYAIREADLYIYIEEQSAQRKCGQECIIHNSQLIITDPYCVLLIA